MENLHKLCIAVCWGLLLMHTAAERQYFISPHNASWPDARNHCQVCFKEMVTLTPLNIDIITKIINSTHWIGLRKYINYNDTYNETDDFDSEPDINFESYNSTNTSSKSFGTPWTLWANGDPLVFQNWYPGFPLFKSPLPKIDCCSCSCTCPAPPTTTAPTPTTTVTSPSPTGSTAGLPTGPVVAEHSSRDSTAPNVTVTEIYDNMTDSTSFYDVETETDAFANATKSLNATQRANTQPWESTTAVHTTAVHTTDSPWTTTPQPPIISTCERSPMLPPVIPENNENYIENSCVAILASGPWVESECFEELPFICYEDRFMGAIGVSNITSSSAALQWDQGPGDISHYRFEASSAKDSWNVTKNMHTLNYTLDNLIPGTGYSIKVFAVKCDRDLNPLSGSFYTIPGEVQNLTVIGFAETTISMNWTKPDGNFDFFEVTASSTEAEKPHVFDNIKEVGKVFEGLTQGSQYTFVFRTGVNDRSMWSKNISILNCTRPGNVSNLKALEIQDTSLELQWDRPEGHYTDFNVTARHGNEDLNVTVRNLTSLLSKPHKVKVSGLQNGTKLDFLVKVLGVCGLEGKIVNITTYTAPGPISNLKLTSTHDTIEAEWDFTPNPGSNVTFRAKLFLNGKEEKPKDISEKKVLFDHLKTATQYEVKVYAVLNDLESPGRNLSIYTLPSPPTGAKEISSTKNSLTFQWIPPEKSSARAYNCTLNSTFWAFFRSQAVIDTTTCNFTNLKSGSTYDFNVYTLSDDKTSNPASCNGTTDEDPVEIGLSMLCASEESLYCQKDETRMAVFAALQNHFKEILGGNVYHKVDTIPAST